jgi:hypothetical protein
MAVCADMLKANEVFLKKDHMLMDTAKIGLYWAKNWLFFLCEYHHLHFIYLIEGR